MAEEHSEVMEQRVEELAMRQGMARRENLIQENASEEKKKENAPEEEKEKNAPEEKKEGECFEG